VPTIAVKFTPLLEIAFTVTTTGPVVAPDGTGAAMLVSLQLVGVAGVPLKVTVLLPSELPIFSPATGVPTSPEFGVRLVIWGAGSGNGTLTCES
jgi:hypothetical protein